MRGESARHVERHAASGQRNRVEPVIAEPGRDLIGQP